MSVQMQDDETVSLLQLHSAPRNIVNFGTSYTRERIALSSAIDWKIDSTGRGKKIVKLHRAPMLVMGRTNWMVLSRTET